MKTVYCVNPVNELHLQEVMEEMVRRDEGPMVQAVDFEGFMVALEGTHRLEAARRLGYPVVLLPIDRKEIVKRGDVEGLFLGGIKSIKAKQLGLNLMKKRSKNYTPIYIWDDEYTGLLTLKFYPTCSMADTARIVFKVTAFWVAFAAVVSTFVWLT